MDRKDFESKSIDWLEGYMSACYNWAVWKNGTMYLGYGITRYEEVKELVQGVIKEKMKENLAD